MNEIRPTLIVICGCAGFGKTTIGKRLGEALGLHVADNDAIIKHCFGKAPDDGKTYLKYYGLAYQTMFFFAERLLAIGTSLIVTAQFSSYDKGQRPLMEIAKRTGARLKTIWLRGDPRSMSDEELQHRLDVRAKDDYLGVAEKADFFKALHAKFEPILIPGRIEIDTWPNNDPDTTFEKALAYCKNPETGCTPGEEINTQAL